MYTHVIDDLFSLYTVYSDFSAPFVLIHVTICTICTGVESIEGMNIGDRCQVNPGKRRGEIKFLGEVPQLKGGHWVGVVFDEPVGMTNGTVKDVSYFECAESYGSFVRAKNMEVGDFPEKDLMDEDEDDEEEI